MFRKIILATMILSMGAIAQTQQTDTRTYNGNVIRDARYGVPTAAFVDSSKKNIYPVSDIHPMPTSDKTAYTEYTDTLYHPNTSLVYAIGQAIGSKLLKFKYATAGLNKTATLTMSVVISDSATLASGSVDLILLKDSANVTIPTDGVLYSLPTAAAAQLIDIVPISLTNLIGTTLSQGSSTGLNIQCQSLNSSGTIYGVLRAQSTWKRNVLGKLFIRCNFLQ